MNDVYCSSELSYNNQWLESVRLLFQDQSKKDHMKDVDLQLMNNHLAI